MKYYKVRKGIYATHIEPCEVDRVTDNSVFINGKRNAKFSEWHNYLPTFEASKNFLIHDAKSQVQTAQSRLDSAKEYLAKIEALSEC